MGVRKIDYYRKVRSLTEEICARLSAEDSVVQTITDVSPPKWHLAHTSWYFEEFLLKDFMPSYKVFDERFSYLFNSYYHSKGQRLAKDSRGGLNRPLLTEVMDYRRYVDEAVERFLKDVLAELPEENIKTAELLFAIGLNHEQQHQELMLYDIKHIFGTNGLQLAYGGKYPTHNPAKRSSGFYDIEEGLYEIGHSGREGEFFFDNEQPRHKRYIYPLKIAESLVSNSDYLEFIKDGGYEDPLLWLSDGWDWLQETGIDRPLYWQAANVKENDIRSKDIDEWHEYSLAGLNKLQKNAPLCHISYYEAEAFARWAGCRLPKEEEWEAAAETLEPREIGAKADNSMFLDFNRLHPHYGHNGESPFAGGLWEWTGSYYLPYPGYQRDKGALGEYNGKFMAGQLVLKGGSCVTPADHYRHSYRNFFHPSKRWLFSGIRLAKDNS